MQIIDGQTKVYGIIGDPVSHSLSPLFQNRFFQQQAMNANYLPFQVDAEELITAIGGLHAANIQGLNVTIPHKEAVLPLVRADSDAKLIGAANTLRRKETTWEATNTDWVGFSAVIQGLQVNVEQSPVFLFGAGGTARAILHALNAQQTKHVFLCNRNKNRAEKLASELSEKYTSMKVTIIEWNQEDINISLPQCRLIINSTSIGLNADDTFPFELLGKGCAIDAVYKPNGETAFTQAAQQYNAVDGLPMLIAQGIASFAFWQAEPFDKPSINLPNRQVSLHWVEEKLGREPSDLPGWRA